MEVTKIGQPSPVSITSVLNGGKNTEATPPAGAADDGNTPPAGATGDGTTPPAGTPPAGSTEEPKDDIADDVVIAALKKKGFNVENFEELTKKFAPAPVELSEEDKKKAETEMEKKQLDVYVAAGGVPENFYALKRIAEMDLTQLSEQLLKDELKASGFDDDEVAEVIKERYYQIELDKLEQEEFETPEQFATRKAKLEKKLAFGKSRIEGKGKAKKDLAVSTFDNLRKAIEESDLQKREQEKEENELSSKVDEISSSYPTKTQLELGKLSGTETEIAPIEYQVEESDIAEVVAELKDNTARNNILFTEEGKINIKEIFELRLQNKIMKKQLRLVYHEGASRQAEIFGTVFPHQAKDLGIGAAPTGGGGGTPGKIASAGKPVPASRPR